MAPDRSVKYWMPKRIQRHLDLTVKAIGEINPKLFDLTDILYQRDRETIAFVRPDLAVSGTGSWPVAQVAGIRAPSAV